MQYDTPDKSGASLRQHLAQVGKTVDDPDVPNAWAYALEYFKHLSRQRQSGGFGLSPLSFTEIKSWSELTATILSPFDVELICAMDRAYLGAMAERTSE